MKRRIPKNYTILIACTGKKPIAFTFKPLAVLILLIALVSLPIGWVAKVVYAYAHKNTQLTEQNSKLTAEAANILEQVEALEGEIEHLQERAGLSETLSSPDESQPSRPQGGLEQTVGAEMLLKVAIAKLPGLVVNLRREVQPALEKTLDREAARPTGLPLKGRTEISSGFGLRRNPFGRNYEFHDGLDFKGAYETAIHVTAPGVIVKAEWSGGYGYHVVVDHGYGYQTLYGHMSKLAVTSGMQVEHNHIVGYLGNTGRSSGPHLHYAIYLNGEAIDPKYYLN